MSRASNLGASILRRLGWPGVIAALWLAAAIVMLLVMDATVFRTGYLLLTLAASFLCFIAYGLDKRRARKDEFRIRERTLHLFALAGGWPGAILGQRMFRHKTQKLGFRAKLWLIVAAHLVLIWLLVM